MGGSSMTASRTASRVVAGCLALLCAWGSAAARAGAAAADSHNTSEIEASTYPIGPEYTHPEGVEAYDPYNKKSFPHKEDKELKPIGEDHNDYIPEISGGHLLEGISDGLPIFLLEPEDSYVVKNKPATIKCQAAGVLQVFFKCNDVRIMKSEQFEHVDPQSGVRIVESEYNVTRDKLEEFFGEKFECVCVAWSSRGQIRSRPVAVGIAYIKKQFGASPSSVSVEAGADATLRCAAPAAAPPPRVQWLRHGAPLPPDRRLSVSAGGDLLVSSASLQDLGNYTCVAQNVAGTRISEAALLTVYVNGGWSDWSPWTACRCGGRAASGQRRSRTCSEPHPINGGAPCQGQATQRTADCVPCQNGASAWSQWSDWTPCAGPECTRRRGRQCAGVSCSGAAEQRAACRSVDCGGVQPATQRATASARDLAPLCVGISVAAALFFAGSALIYILLRGRNRRPLYTVARSDLSPDGYPTTDKKMAAGADVTRPLRDYLPQERLPRVDHHYDVPHLMNSYATPVDQRVLPSSSIDDVYESKPYSGSDQSSSSCFTSSAGSTYDACAESVSLQLAELVSNSATSVSSAAGGAGARLALPAAGVALSVPEGALCRSRRDHLYLALVKDDRYRPRFSNGTTQLSPVVKCGPPSIKLSKSFILHIPHCASLKHGHWKFIIYGVENSICKTDTFPRWKKLSTLGEETAKTLIFTQVDESSVYIVSDFFSHYVLMGESIGGRAMKIYKVAIFYKKLSLEQEEYEISVYILEDVPSAYYLCKQHETNRGGVVVEDKTFYFQDGDADLCLDLESLNPGWYLHYGMYQDWIEFSEIWNSKRDSVQYKYILRQRNRNSRLECQISFYQKTNLALKQIFKIEIPSRSYNFKDSFENHNLYRTENMLESRTLPERSNQDSGICLKHKSYTVNDVGRNTTRIESPFRLDSTTKRRLCVLLDPPKSRGNDWTMLAQRMNINRYAAWFATKSSPTECILDLWECRSRGDGAPAELVALLRDMDRQDAADVLSHTVRM